jgi:DNA integrity scanning protein DisA with diadenylate cyclase activity
MENEQLENIKIALGKSKNKLSFDLKYKMAELIIKLTQNQKNFGVLIVLGWQDKWQKYADTPDSSQDIFVQQDINIMKINQREPKRSDITNTINFDGAILVDSLGNILHSGVMIEGLRPRATADKINPTRSDDLSSQFGFKKKVHMRHITAITSSYLFKGTTIFTVSEETNDLHIFENGKIIYSTVFEE